MTLDLWTPIVDEARLHPNFKTVQKVASKSCFDVINGWAEGFHDRDGKFVKEFQLTFNPCFWELYLHASFRELGYESVFNHSSPDFELHYGDDVVIAEAAVASNAGGYRPEWDKQGVIRPNSFELYEAVRYTTLRIANAIVGKSKKYQELYQALSHVRSRPYVVCVAPFDFPFSFDWAQTAMRAVVFGIDEPLVHIDDEGNRMQVGFSEAMSVTKKEGVEVPLGLFRSKEYAHISAIVFSSLATFSKVRAMSDDPEPYSSFMAERYNEFGTAPLRIAAMKPEYRESLLDGLIVCVNPFANHPLDLEPFHGREVALEGWDIDRDQYVGYAPHEWLIRRFVITASPSVSKQDDGPGESNSYKEFNRPKWPDRVLRPINAVVGVGINNHLGHVDEWTAAVFQDAVDGTWHSMAVERLVYSLPAFRDANDGSTVRTLAAFEDHSSREEAFAHICQLIEEAQKQDN